MARAMGLQRRPPGVNTKIKICRWDRSRIEHNARLSRQSRADEEGRDEAELPEEPGFEAGVKPGAGSDDEGGGTGDECSPGPETFSSQGPRRDSDGEEERHGGAGTPLQAT